MYLFSYTCMCLDMFLKSEVLFFILVCIFVSINSQSVCPSTAFLKNRASAIENTKRSIQQALSIEGETDRELYQAVATKLQRPVSSNEYELFLDSIKDIAAATIQFCDTLRESINISNQVSELLKEFRSLVKAKQFQGARKVYGKLICLRSISSTVRSRRDVSSDDLDTFFRCLEGKLLKQIIFDYIEAKVVLAFVVDDTGSMGTEIAAVKHLILSFVKTEQKEPFYYMLSTFNDPVERMFKSLSMTS